MKKQKNKFKKVLPAALACLTLIGASAWLTNKETQTGVNVIKEGTIGIEFVDTDGTATRDGSKIELSGDKAIPMTHDYAKENIEPYKFSLKNTGEIDLDYTVYLVTDENTFGYSAINAIAAEYEVYDDDLGTYYTDIHRVYDANAVLMYQGTLAAGETVDYNNFRLYLKEELSTEQCAGKYYKGHLEVVAAQTNQPYIETITMKFANEDEGTISISSGYSFKTRVPGYGIDRPMRSYWWEQDYTNTNIISQTLQMISVNCFFSIASDGKVTLLRANSTNTGVLANEILDAEGNSLDGTTLTAREFLINASKGVYKAGPTSEYVAN